MPRYIPEPVPMNLPPELQEYLARELARISDAILVQDVDEITVENATVTDLLTAEDVIIENGLTIGNDVQIEGPNPIFTLQDSDGVGAAAIAYIRFMDSAGVRQGYVGDGSGGDQNLIINSDVAGIRMVTNAAPVTLENGATLHIEAVGDASLSSTTHGLQVGLTSGANVIMDNNEIMARNNGATSPLFLQGDGGSVSCGGSVLAAEGFQFPATQFASASANNLDDYEEGTWTPVIRGTTITGTGTYTGTPSGSYTKIGRAVFVDCTVTWSAHTGTGDMQIDGLPFTPHVNTGAMSVVVSSIVLPATSQLYVQTMTVGRLQPATATIAGGGLGGLAMDTAGTFRVAGVYNT